MKKRLTSAVLAALLALCMAVSVLPVNIHADYTFNYFWNDKGFKFSRVMDENENVITMINSDGYEVAALSIGSGTISGDVQIPDEKGAVICIRTEGFMNNSKITGVTIPNSVKFIGYRAFAYCNNLQSIQLPDSIEEIRGSAFVETAYYRNKDNWDNGVLYIGNALIACDQEVTDVVVREGITVIADGAFSACALDRVFIPQSVKHIGKTAFSGSAVKAINVSPSNPYYCVENGVLYNKEKTEAFKCVDEKTGNLVLPDTVKKIHSMAFQKSRLTSVVLPEGLTEIGYAAFASSEITKLNIPKTVTSIARDAFSGIEKKICTNINNVYYLDNVLVKANSRNDIIIEPGTRMIMTLAFQHYTASNQNIVIPNSVEIIAPDAFASVNIKSIYISGKGLCLSRDTFRGSAEEITIADGVDSIQYHAIWASKINTINLKNPNIKFQGAPFLFSDDSLKKVVLPEGLTELPGYIFSGCRNLESIDFPQSLITIGDEAFRYCEKLEKVTIPENVKQLSNSVFNDCSQLKEVTILNPDIKMYNAIFNHCENLNDVFFNGTKEQWNSNQNIRYFVTLCDTNNITVHFMKESDSAAQPISEPTTQPTSEPTTQPTSEPTTQPTAQPVSFSDIPKDAYYAEPVAWAVNHDPQITNGTSATHFSPNANCTRGQIVTFLWRAKGQPEPKRTDNPFVDVKPSDYYYKAVLWAVEQEITNGTDATHFSPNASCTRGQAVTFLWRAEGKPAQSGGANAFTDVKPGQYYYDAVLWAVKNGITNGTSATTFSPDATCTRGQIVTFLYRDMA